MFKCLESGCGEAVTLRWYLFNGQTFKLLNLTLPTSPDSFMQNLLSNGYRLNLGSSLHAFLPYNTENDRYHLSHENSQLHSHFNYF